MKDNITKEAIWFFLIFVTSVIMINLFTFNKAYAFEKANYMAKIGAAFPENRNPLNHYWLEGFTLGLGRRLPLDWPGKEVDYWLNGEITKFGFNKESSFPIRSYYFNAVNDFYGDPVYFYYIYLQIRISFIDPSKQAVPYIHYGNGYFHRSKTILKSNLPNLSYSEIKNKGAYGSSMGVGIDFKINKRARFLIDFSICGGATSPLESMASIWSMAFLFW